MGFLNGIIDSFANFGYGTILALVVVLILAILVYAIKGGSSFSPFNYIVCAILALLLVFQFAPMFGAFSVKNKLKDADDISSFLLSGLNLNDELPVDVNNAIDELSTQIPFLSDIVKGYDLSSINDIRDSFVDKASSYLNHYIVRCVIWAVLICLVGTLCMYFMPNPISERHNKRSNRNYATSSRRERHYHRY